VRDPQRARLAALHGRLALLRRAGLEGFSGSGSPAVAAVGAAASAKAAAWLAHAYTASGVVLAFLATRDIINHDYRTAFFWLYLQVFVDATDGMLARRARVSDVLPWFSGSKLDDLIDYLTYVFVPALLVWRGLLVPDAWTIPVACAMLLSSGYGFSRLDAKTPDHFFTGFPSYWNIVVFYLVVAGWPSGVNAAILLALAVMVFVPIKYVYPSRTPVLQVLTVSLGAVWAVLMLVMLWQYPAVSPWVFGASLVFPVYYTLLSFGLHFRR
jgi:phosphatidylcholine synthase